MSIEHETCNQCVPMNHDLMIEIHFNPESRYMETRKNGIESLIWSFSHIFCWATDGRVIKTYILENILLINVGVHVDTFSLFETDYERFMETIFGGVAWKTYEINRLEVFDPAQKKLQLEQQLKQQFIENA